MTFLNSGHSRKYDFNIFLKLKVKLLLSGKLKLKVFSRYFTTIFRPNCEKN